MNDLEIAQAVSTILSKYSNPVASGAGAATATTPAADTAPHTEQSLVSSIVAQVLAQQQPTTAAPQPSAHDAGIFDSMDEAIAAAAIAQVQYRHCSMQDRNAFVKGVREVFLQEDVLDQISRMAVEETGMGNYEDKLTKNRIAALKTPGTEDLATQVIGREIFKRETCDKCGSTWDKSG